MDLKSQILVLLTKLYSRNIDSKPEVVMYQCKSKDCDLIMEAIRRLRIHHREFDELVAGVPHESEPVFARVGHTL